jgi:hypothetical protein
VAKKTGQAKGSSANSGNFLSADDIIRGGENPYRQVVVPELKKNGSSGVIVYKPIPAITLLSIWEEGLSGKDQVTKTANMLSDLLVNPDGSQMFTEGQLLNASTDTLTAILNAMVASRGSGLGNVSSETDGGDLPID